MLLGQVKLSPAERLARRRLLTLSTGLRLPNQGSQKKLRRRTASERDPGERSAHHQALGPTRFVEDRLAYKEIVAQLLANTQCVRRKALGGVDRCAH